MMQIDWSKAYVTVRVPVAQTAQVALQEFDIPLDNLLVLMEHQKKLREIEITKYICEARGE